MGTGKVLSMVMIFLCGRIFVYLNVSAHLSYRDHIWASFFETSPNIKRVDDRTYEDGTFLPYTHLSDWRVIFVTHNRFKLLDRGMRSFYSQIGADKFDCIVSLDNIMFRDQAIEVVKRLVVDYPFLKGRVRFLLRYNISKGNWWAGYDVPLTEHVWYGMKRLFDGQNTYGVVLEDDLVFAPDFVEMLSVTGPVIERDPTIFCVSGWNGIISPKYTGDISRLVRRRYFAGLGWMMTRKSSKLLETMSQLPIEKLTPWDFAIYLNMRDRDLDCVSPHLPRTKHLGSGGIHYTNTDEFDRAAFASHSLPGKGTFDKAVKSLAASDFDKDNLNRVKQAKQISFHQAINPNTVFENNALYIADSDLQSDCLGALSRRFESMFYNDCAESRQGLFEIYISAQNTTIFFADRVRGKKWLEVRGNI